MAKRLKSILFNPWKKPCPLRQCQILYGLLVIQASISASLQQIYAFNKTDIGLCYFAIGYGAAIGGDLNGMISRPCCLLQDSF